MSSIKEPFDRRELLRGIGRWAALALAGMGAFLATRQSTDPNAPRSSDCLGQSACQGCPSVDHCRQPAAAASRLEPPNRKST